MLNSSTQWSKNLNNGQSAILNYGGCGTCEELKEISEIVDICATFQASIADYERI